GGIEFEEGYHYIFAARFAAGDRNLVEIYSTDRDGAQWTTEYRRTGKGDWEVAWRGKGVHERGRNSLEVFVKEGLDQPSVLVASRRPLPPESWLQAELRCYNLDRATARLEARKQRATLPAMSPV